MKHNLGDIIEFTTSDDETCRGRIVLQDDDDSTYLVSLTSWPESTYPRNLLSEWKGRSDDPTFQAYMELYKDTFSLWVHQYSASSPILSLTELINNLENEI